MQNKAQQHLPWRLYLQTTFEIFIAFYLATFSLTLFFKYRNGTSYVAMIILYVLVICMCCKQLAKKLPLQALMIVIPIAPFLALSIVLTLIPILEIF